MASPCFYHPDRIAANQCAQCGAPICADCTDRVGEKTVCVKCVQAVRTRLEQQMAAAPPPQAQGYQAPGYGGPTPVGGGPTFGGGSFVQSAAPLDAGKLILGIVAATLIGLIGAIAVEKVQFTMHFGLSLLYVFIGYGIGFGLHAVTKRGGLGMACLAVGIMVACLLVSHLVLASDYLAAARAAGDVPAGVTPAAVLPDVLKGQNFMHWVLILIGLYSCFKGVNSKQ